MNEESAYDLFNENDIDLLIIESKKHPIILVFSADWLGSAHILESFLAEIVQDFPGTKLIKVNIENNEATAAKMGVSQIPTTFIFWKGKITNAFSGLLPKKKIRTFLEMAIID
ncbi:MAG: thioredoxin family protein [Saprospiraceae bacterium]